MMTAPEEYVPGLSPTQVDQATRCYRLWWFQKVMKLPAKPTAAKTFGTVIHSVLDRHFSADDNGRDENGNPVDLFPPGWETCKDGTISPAEQDMVRKLITRAFDEGIMDRPVGRQVERPFEIPLRSGELLRGKIDLIAPGVVVDHKSPKKRRYIKGPKALIADPQMLIYAKAARYLGMADKHDRVTVAHNSFCKDPDDPIIKRTQTDPLPPETVDAYWELVEGLAIKLRDLRSFKGPWKEVVGPNRPGACNEYGGCDYLTICLNQETPEEYLLRRTNGAGNNSPNPNPTPNQVSQMDLKSMMANRAAAMGAAPVAPAPVAAPAAAPQAAAPVAQPAPAAAPQAAAPADLPPWAVPGCTACGTSPAPGFNSLGKPCRICVSHQASQNGPLPEEFDIWVDGSGKIMWREKGLGGAAPAPVASAPIPTQSGGVAPAVAQFKQQEPPAAAPAAPTPQAAPSQLPWAKPAPAAAPAAAPAQAEAPAAGWHQATSPIQVVVPMQYVAEVPDEPAASAAQVLSGTAPKPVAKLAPPAKAAAPAGDTVPEVLSRKGRGRPPASFTLLVGCQASKGVSKQQIHLEELFQQMADQLAASSEASFYGLDVWERRAALSQWTKALVDGATLKGTIVCAPSSPSPDMRAVYDVLRAYADTIYEVSGR